MEGDGARTLTTRGTTSPAKLASICAVPLRVARKMYSGRFKTGTSHPFNALEMTFSTFGFWSGSVTKFIKRS